MIKGINNALILCAALASCVTLADELPDPEQRRVKEMLQKQTHPLTDRQKALALIAATAAAGNLPGLNAALERGLNDGLSISDCREALVQLYAYAGFPRSLNALAELMKIADARRLQGRHDEPGREPGPLPTPEEMLAAGTRNQTALVGKPVQGKLFEFAPAIDQYLKSHLFGDIFARDNLSWKNRELATVGALSSIKGVESQLTSHLHISMNVGLSAEQLAELVPYFEAQGEKGAAQQLRSALEALKKE